MKIYVFAMKIDHARERICGPLIDRHEAETGQKCAGFEKYDINDYTAANRRHDAHRLR